jgi:hypothetical protein
VWRRGRNRCSSVYNYNWELRIRTTSPICLASASYIVQPLPNGLTRTRSLLTDRALAPMQPAPYSPELDRRRIHCINFSALLINSAFTLSTVKCRPASSGVKTSLTRAEHFQLQLSFSHLLHLLLPCLVLSLPSPGPSLASPPAHQRLSLLAGSTRLGGNISQMHTRQHALTSSLQQSYQQRRSRTY